MEIRVPTTRLRDIGPLDHAARLPTKSRIASGRQTVCRRCGKAVEDEHFIGGFKAGMPNMILHESCWDGSGTRIGQGWEGN